MTTKIKNILPFLEFLYGLKNVERIDFFKTAKKNTLKSIIDLIFNVYLGNISIPSEIVAQLRPLKKQIELLCKQKISLKERKKIIMSKYFFQKFFSIVLPYLVREFSK